VKFDANGWVAATQFISLADGQSLDEQLEDWATRSVANSPVNRSTTPT